MLNAELTHSTLQRGQQSDTARLQYQSRYPATGPEVAKEAPLVSDGLLRFDWDAPDGTFNPTVPSSSLGGGITCKSALFGPAQSG